MYFQSSGELIEASILVFLDVSGVLVEKMELAVGNSSYMKKLDYEGVPFRCRIFHHH
jgi:hypothetical protein